MNVTESIINAIEKAVQESVESLSDRKVTKLIEDATLDLRGRLATLAKAQDDTDKNIEAIVARKLAALAPSASSQGHQQLAENLLIVSDQVEELTHTVELLSKNLASFEDSNRRGVATAGEEFDRLERRVDKLSDEIDKCVTKDGLSDAVEETSKVADILEELEELQFKMCKLVKLFGSAMDKVGLND